MVIKKDTIFSMLIVEKYFKTFIPSREVCDTKKYKEILTALSVDSKKEVDDLVNKAIKAGAKEFRDTQDMGWMYVRAFEDLDNHVWEIFFMDMDKMPKEMKK